MVATAALQEDVDVVGLSILSGAHMTLLPRICELLRAEGLDDVLVTAGGIIHDMRCDGTEEHGVNDVAEFDKQTAITVVATFEDGVHVLRPVGMPIEVKRWLDGDDLVWQYVGVTCRLTRTEGS